MLEDYAGMAVLKREGEPYHDDPGYWQCVRPGESLKLASGATLSNHGNEDAFIRLDANGRLWQEGGNRLELVGPGKYTVPKDQAQALNGLTEAHKCALGCIAPGTAVKAPSAVYPPMRAFEKPGAITATQARQAQEAAHWGTGDDRLADAYLQGQKAESLKSQQAERMLKLAHDERDLWQTRAIESEEDRRVRGDALIAITGLCKQAQDKLAETERYAKTLEATIAELNRQLGNEPKPNPRDMSRLSHLGESHVKSGLRLFDGYN